MQEEEIVEGGNQEENDEEEGNEEEGGDEEVDNPQGLDILVDGFDAIGGSSTTAGLTPSEDDASDDF
uniref:Uncharacterized protein n=1 Tax=Meloidogyne javanica TaxID=6303 RepID=A0A915MEC7_MELJA